MIGNIYQNGGSTNYAPVMQFSGYASSNQFDYSARHYGYDRNGDNDRFSFAYRSMDNDARVVNQINGDALHLSNENWRNGNGETNISSERSTSISTEDNDSNGSSTKGNGNQTVLLPNTSVNGNDTPDHHARRPMNAFLIFCKRHRGIVRERFPNLENRAITKILGDWWANLSQIEKACYTDLAKQYKDAFLSANPDFKWYKLPAPPLRSSTTVRANDEHDDKEMIESDENVPTQLSKRLNGYNHPKNGNQQNIFKLADETQMGGLNSLMMAAEVVSGKHINNNNKYQTNNMTKNVQTTEGDNDNRDELHRVLGETRSFLQSTINEMPEQPDIFTFETSNNYIPKKMFRKQLSSSSGSETKSNDLDSPFDDDEHKTIMKSSRACKGKRYMEFMIAQTRMNPIGKRPKSRTTSSSSSASLSPTQTTRPSKTPIQSNCVHRVDFETFDHLYANPNYSPTIMHPVTSSPCPIPETEPIESPASSSLHGSVAGSPPAAGTFDANDFELDQKIQALPAHNVDEYLTRKQTTKKKKIGEKKTGNAGHYRKMAKVTKTKNKSKLKAALTDKPTVELPKTFEEAKARLTMVGSQKRKARKESITRRRDVQQVTAIVQAISSSDIQNAFATVREAKPIEMNLQDTNGVRCGTSGLLMLATMAEVASANYTV